MKILLVEDDNFLSHGLQMALQETGYAVELSKDGAKADLLLTANPYDLVVLDLELPAMDGLEMLEIMKRFRKREHATPVLILTAREETRFHRPIWSITQFAILQKMVRLLFSFKAIIL